jgi:hypothetical protein
MTDPDASILIAGMAQDLRGPCKIVRYKPEFSLQYMTQELNSRQYTLDTDVLNAFTGLARWLGRLSGWTFWHGLPLEIFDAVFVFNGTHDRPRRQGYPSWSLLGWKPKEMFSSPIFYDSSDHYIAKLEWMRWSQDESGKICYQVINSSSICKQPADVLGGFPSEDAKKEAKRLHGVSESTAPADYWYFIRGPQACLESPRARLAKNSGWWMPTDRRAPIRNPPKFLSKQELENLLVVQTSYTVLEVEFIEVDAISHCEGPPGV